MTFAKLRMLNNQFYSVGGEIVQLQPEGYIDFFRKVMKVQSPDKPCKLGCS